MKICWKRAGMEKIPAFLYFLEEYGRFLQEKLDFPAAVCYE